MFCWRTVLSRNETDHFGTDWLLSLLLPRFQQINQHFNRHSKCTPNNEQAQTCDGGHGKRRPEFLMMQA